MATTTTSSSTSTQRPIWTRQPFKGLYVTVMLTSMLIRLPWWFASNLIPSWRPIPRWSLGLAVKVRLVRFIVGLNDVVKGSFPPAYTYRALDTRPEARGVYVDGVPELIHGKLKEWVEVANVEPIRLPGYWIHKEGSSIITGEKPSPGEKVVYFLHGGGYVELTAHPTAITSNIPKLLLKECEKIKRSFAIEYRLTVGLPLEPANPFPTALVDALAGYNYLVNTVGFAPEDIIVVGDSAGGNLALALARYLVEYSAQLSDALTAHPIPGAMFLLSPWTDMSIATHDDPNASYYTKRKSDMIVGPSCLLDRTPNDNYNARSFVGPHGYEPASLINPYISPGSPVLPEGCDSYKGFPKTMIIVGDAELLLDQVRLVKERMERDLGKESGMVTYFKTKDAVHDSLILDWHENGRKETIEAVKEWIAEL